MVVVVEITIQNGNRSITERMWHRGDLALEHIASLTGKPSFVLPR